MAQKRLMQELAPLQKEKWVNIVVSKHATTQHVGRRGRILIYCM